KIKTTYSVVDFPALMIITYHDAKLADKALGKNQSTTKDNYPIKTSCAVFRFLRLAGIPMAFRRQLSGVAYLSRKYKTLPLRVVVRRYATEDYVKRYPAYAQKEGTPPYEFIDLKTDFFLQKKGIDLRDVRGNIHQLTHIKEPLILNQFSQIFALTNPELLRYDQFFNLECSITKDKIISAPVSLGKIEKMAEDAFKALESGWKNLGLRLIDLNLEFGFDTDENLLITGTIDNTSWELRTLQWEESIPDQTEKDKPLRKIKKGGDLIAILAEKLSLVPKKSK
ncbi:MAG: hypothetical protein NT091_04885, partial [Candidatus Falkowbacteria bacterium]|nr:hypothetical protein [Candidatus Falkowbacteria bacterium]